MERCLPAFILILSVTLLGGGCGLSEITSNNISERKISNKSVTPIKKSIQNRAYIIYYPGKARMIFSVTRSSEDDEDVVLTVPGTYTSPKGQIEGWAVAEGTILRADERQGWNGAVVISRRGEVSIVNAWRNKLLTRAYLRALAEAGGSFFQAHLLVDEGQVVAFKPQALYERRALGIFEDGRTAIIQSVDWIDLNQFANDLVALGIKNAVNLDMGDYGEGWYRDREKGIVRIGTLGAATERQSNWIVFRSEE